jgi:peptide deformylase
MNKKEGARLKIRLFGDSMLRKRALPVKGVTQSHRDTLSEMSRIMYASSGIGLAAPQVGINESMIVVDMGSGLYKLINPKIVKKEGLLVMEEGCLSVPGICIKVKRSRHIIIETLDEFARPVTIEAEDLLSCVLQHEIDHLNGKLIVDYASFLERLKMVKALQDLKKRPKDERLSQQETKSCKLQL